MTAASTAVRAEQLWFLDTLVTVRVAHADGEDGISVLESLAPHGDSPPLHVHHAEDELFHVVEGELRLRVGDDEDVRLVAGDTLLAAKGVPHTYRVESAEGCRWLVTTTRGDFERLVRSLGRPAEAPELPSPSGPPPPEQAGALAAACLENGVELVGPPLGP